MTDASAVMYVHINLLPVGVGSIVFTVIIFFYDFPAGKFFV